MPRYIAFLRAINITNHWVKMDDLRRHFDAMGFSNVQTFIQSGNVLFETMMMRRQIEAHIEAGLRNALGYDVATFARDESELADVAQQALFDESTLVEGDTVYVAFLKGAPAATAQEKLMSLASDIDELSLFGNHLFWLYRRHRGQSRITLDRLERALNGPVTVRNISTVQKLAAKHL
jgi:uncharacterized protein (DUF1697 family)